MKKIYKIYPEKIVTNTYYWLRRTKNLNLVLVRVIACFKPKETPNKYFEKKDEEFCDEYIVEINERDRIKARRGDLLIFHPETRIFYRLMRLANYRHDSYIKKAIMAMGYSPEKYMRVYKQTLNIKDWVISKNEFCEEYRKFFSMDHPYCDEIISEITSLIVTGTSNLDIYMLYKIVCKNGGMERVTEDQKWKYLFYEKMSKTNVSYTIRTFYKKYLYEFECARRFEEDAYCFNYKYEIKQNVYFVTEYEVYYGTVKLRRNMGLNQYYIQFFGWSKENSEWYSEDVLFSYNEPLSLVNKSKRKTRSSKANNLVDDPLTREKHSHLGQKVGRIKVLKKNEFPASDSIFCNNEILENPHKLGEIRKDAKYDEEQNFSKDDKKKEIPKDFNIFTNPTNLDFRIIKNFETESDSNKIKIDNEIIKNIPEKKHMGRPKKIVKEKILLKVAKSGRKAAEMKSLRRKLAELDVYINFDLMDEWNYRLFKHFNIK